MATLDLENLEECSETGDLSETIVDSLGLTDSCLGSIVGAGVDIYELYDENSDSIEQTKKVVSYAAQLLGFGADLCKFDTTSYSLGVIQGICEDIQDSVDLVLSVPLKLALKSYKRVLLQMDSNQTTQDIQRTIEELKTVREKAIEAFEIAKEQAANPETIKDAVLAKRLSISADVKITAFTGTKLVPFFNLDLNKKLYLAKLIESDIVELLKFTDGYKVPWYTWNKAEKEKVQEDEVDSLLKVFYPLLSEGRGLHSHKTIIQSPLKLMVLPQFLPNGAEDRAQLKVGKEGGKPRSLFVWKEGRKVMVLSWEGRRIEVDIPAEVDPQGLQLVVPFPGERQGVSEMVSEVSSCRCRPQWRCQHCHGAVLEAPQWPGICTGETGINGIHQTSPIPKE